MSTSSSPERKALDYAELTLGVHKVFEEAKEKRQALADANLKMLDLRAARRGQEQYLEDLKMEVIEEERSTNPSESQAAFDRRIKVVFSNNGAIREGRDRLLYLAGDIETVEYEIEMLTKDIQIAVARMQELGGYLQFLAVIKQANASRETKNHTDGNPW